MTYAHHRSALGAAGEIIACDYLVDRGHQILDRNARYDCGEIDIVSLAPDDTVVFVEVKTRSSHYYGTADAIDARKFARLRKAAARWLATTAYVAVRFDVIVIIDTPACPILDHYVGVDNGAS